MTLRPVVYSTDPDAHLRDKRRTGKRAFNCVKTLQTRQRRIIELHVEGLMGTQIAKYLGITDVNVSNVLSSEMGKAAIEQEEERRRLDRKRNEVAIAEAVGEALNVLKQGMTGTMTVMVKGEDGEVEEKEQVVRAEGRIRAAESFLDRYQPTAKVQKIQQQVSQVVDEESMRELETRFASVMQARAGRMVDVTPSTREVGLEGHKSPKGSGEAPQSLHEVEPREETDPLKGSEER